MSDPSAAGRIVCAKCGANNFDTQAACWRCGAALSGAGRSPASAPPRPAGSGAAPVTSPSAFDAPYRPARDADPAIAAWAAGALAFLFPFVAVPVGLVFLMLDDRRKIEVGKITLIAGTLFSLVHLLATWVLLQPVINLTRGFGAMAGGSSAAAGTGRSPGLNDPVPPLQLPGIPQTPSEPTSSVPFPRP